MSGWEVRLFTLVCGASVADCEDGKGAGMPRQSSGGV